MDLPIACTLTDVELRERRESLLNPLRQLAAEVKPIDGGFSYRFRQVPTCLSAYPPSWTWSGGAADFLGSRSSWRHGLQESGSK
jgi:hypothetical protein